MTYTPDYMPVLSGGPHASPRSGGCFMEVASYLAGERWSDSPECTDVALAGLCRRANDILPNDRRQEIAHLIPDVIGTDQGSKVREEFLEWLGENFEGSVLQEGSLTHVSSLWMHNLSYDDLINALTRIITKFREIAGLESTAVSDSEWRDAKELVSA